MRMLIVDDERLIAQGITHVVNQLKTEFTQVSFACSGREALEEMREHGCDLLLTDITMPEMSGLELIETAMREGLCKEFCILSGYSEFEYARTALTLGVREYLLKPIDKGKLFQLLQDCSAKIRKDAHEKRRAQSHAISDYLFSEASAPDGWGGSAPRFAAVLEGLFCRSAPLFQRNFQKYFEQDLLELVVPVPGLPACFLLGCPDTADTLIKRLLEDFPEMYLGTAVATFPDAEAIRAQYRRTAALALIAHCFLKRRHLDAKEIDGPPANLDALHSVLKASFRVETEPAQDLFYRLYLKNLSADMGKEGEKSDEMYSSKMVEVVEKRYMDNLTLQDIAKEIGLNPDYAGKVFRLEQGISFSEYLNNYRISKILECVLRDPLLHFEELAPRMGFSDMRNFYRVFKRITNTTPGEYRRSMLDRETF